MEPKIVDNAGMDTLPSRGMPTFAGVKTPAKNGRILPSQNKLGNQALVCMLTYLASITCDYVARNDYQVCCQSQTTVH